MIFNSKGHPLRPTGHNRVLICTSSQHLQHLLISNLGKIENLKTGSHSNHECEFESNVRSHDAELESQEKQSLQDWMQKQTNSVIFREIFLNCCRFPIDFGPRRIVWRHWNTYSAKTHFESIVRLLFALLLRQCICHSQSVTHHNPAPTVNTHTHTLWVTSFQSTGSIYQHWLHAVSHALCEQSH